MATVSYVRTELGDGYGGSLKYVWDLTTADADGQVVGPEISQHTDLCFQAIGTNWGAATATMQGSLDGTNWFSLTNAAGAAAITFTADGGKQSIEKPLYLRPNLTVGGTLSVVKIILFARRNPFSRSFR